tara:strand:+ start:3235 stop:3474 length:240 start_codon:yes stop_codon:yes gene_type:complete
MRKLTMQVELEVTRAEFYDFIVEVEVPEDYGIGLDDEELAVMLEDEASALARAQYWEGDHRPYDTQTDELKTIGSRLWD